MTAAAGDRRRLWSVLVVAGLSAALLGVAEPSPRPSSPTWAGLEAWYEAAGPVRASVGLVWLMALTVAAWLVVACALQLIARTGRGGGVRWLADRVAPAALRGLAAASVTTALALSSPMGAGAGDAPGTATLHPLGAEEVTTSSSTVVTSPAAPAEPARPAPATATQPVDYTIRPGDSFWSVARRRLADQAPGSVTTTSHHEYWRRLIAANVDRLVDPGNPDLLYPGQVVVLPALT